MVSLTSPHTLWLSGSEFVVEFLFAFVTLLIAYYAFKVYRILRQRPSLLFGLGFSSVGLAYLVQAILNFFIFIKVDSPALMSFATAGAVQTTSIQLSVLAVIFHMIFMMLGLCLLAYVTLKERGTKIFLLLASLSFIGLVLSFSTNLAFYMITSVFLLFIAAQHYQNLAARKSVSTLLVFLGFSLLFLGNLQLGVSIFFGALYVTGLFTVLIAYLLLLASLLDVVRL